MATTANLIDLSELSPSARREVRDFYQFLLTRRGRTKKAQPAKVDGYHFTDLCGGLAWKGDAVVTQRELRDEW